MARMKNLTVFFFMIVTLPLTAEVLQEMDYEELPADNIVLTDANASLLIIESAIPNLVFDSNRGVILVEVIRTGVYHVRLKPGTQLITIMADGFLPIQNIRYNFMPKRAIKLKVTPIIIAQPEGYGSVRIETDPPACYILFNGIRLPEKTPLVLENQSTGNHKIQLDGGFEWIPLDTVLTILPDTMITYQYRLSNRKIANLRMNSQPEGASVYLDDEFLGTTPLNRNDLVDGEVMIRMELADYQPVTKQILLTEGEETTLFFPLQPQTGMVSISANQPGTELSLDGCFLAVFEDSPLYRDSVKVGFHQVIAFKEGYYETRDSIRIKHNEMTSLEFKLIPKPGSISITSEPAGAKVNIKGGLSDITTPGSIDSVKAGEFLLKGKLNGYHTLMLKGVLEPGSQQNVDLIFKPKQRTGAMWRSALLPGAGQWFAEHRTRGLLLTTAQVLAAAFTVYTHYEYEDKREAYNKARESYLNAITISELESTRERVSDARDDWDNAAFMRDLAFVSVGSVYSINLLDVCILSGGRIKFKQNVIPGEAR